MNRSTIKDFNIALKEAKEMGYKGAPRKRNKIYFATMRIMKKNSYVQKITLEREKKMEKNEKPSQGWWDKYTEKEEGQTVTYDWKAKTPLSPFDDKTMCVGTCRISRLPNNNLNNELNYPQSTKEVIQLLQFIKGEIDIPSPYNHLCFRTAICDNETIKKNEKYSKMFEKAETFVVEISSRKKYVHKNYYLHSLPFDKNYFKMKGKDENFGLSLFGSKFPEVVKNFKIEEQTNEEIESDILAIKRILNGKKLVIVSHLNVEIDGKKIEARENLIYLLKSLCQKHKIHFISPSDLMSDYKQEDYMGIGLNHYSKEGHHIVTSKIINEISKM